MGTARSSSWDVFGDVSLLSIFSVVSFPWQSSTLVWVSSYLLDKGSSIDCTQGWFLSSSPGQASSFLAIEFFTDADWIAGKRCLGASPVFTYERGSSAT